MGKLWSVYELIHAYILLLPAVMPALLNAPHHCATALCATALCATALCASLVDEVLVLRNCSMGPS